MKLKIEIDVKIVIIIALLIGMASYAGYTQYAAKTAEYYDFGTNDGAYWERMNILQSVVSKGYYTLSVARGNETQQLILVPYQDGNTDTTN